MPSFLADKGALAGHYSGGSPATLTFAGHVAAGTTLVLFLMDGSGGAWGPSPRTAGALAHTASPSKGTTPFTDSKGNHYILQGGANDSSATMYLLTSVITTELVAGDTLPLAFVGASTAQFAYYALQAAGALPYPLASDPMLDVVFSDDYRLDELSGGAFTLTSSSPPPFSLPPIPIAQPLQGSYVAAVCYVGSIGAASAGWSTEYTYADGTQSVAVGYAQGDHNPGRNQPSNGYVATGTGRGMEIQFFMPADPQEGTLPRLTYQSGSLVPEGDGQRLDLTYVSDVPAVYDAGSASSKCLPGDPMSLAPAWDFGIVVLAGLAGSLPGLLVAFDKATPLATQVSGTPPDWKGLLQMWTAGLPDDASLVTDPSAIDLTVIYSSELQPASSQACGAALVTQPPVERTGLYVDGALGVGDVQLNGATIIHGGSLSYDGVLAGDTLTFTLATIPVPADAAEGLPIPDLVLLTGDSGVWNKLTATYSVKMSVHFPALVVAPIPVIPLPVGSGGGAPPPPSALIVAGSVAAGAGASAELGPP